jgi:hypothetical protein
MVAKRIGMPSRSAGSDLIDAACRKKLFLQCAEGAESTPKVPEINFELFTVLHDRHGRVP